MDTKEWAKLQESLLSEQFEGCQAGSWKKEGKRPASSKSKSMSK